MITPLWIIFLHPYKLFQSKDIMKKPEKATGICQSKDDVAKILLNQTVIVKSDCIYCIKSNWTFSIHQVVSSLIKTQ